MFGRFDGEESASDLATLAMMETKTVAMQAFWPMGVFTSLDDGLGVQWEVVREFRIPTIHLHAPSRQLRTHEATEALRRKLAEAEVTVTAVFGGFPGESYADIPTTQRTVGLVPVETREARLQEMLDISEFAQRLGCPVVGLHLGFIPSHQAAKSDYFAIVETTRRLCDACGQRNQRVHLETGQESAEGLLHFLDAVNRANLFVNFDPANMILYGTGEPIEALHQIHAYVRSVHCKDATWSDRPGETWGQEVKLGDGDVDFEAFLRALQAIGYTGPLTIEREIPHTPELQRQEIGHAVRELAGLRSRLME